MAKAEMTCLNPELQPPHRSLAVGCHQEEAASPCGDRLQPHNFDAIMRVRDLQGIEEGHWATEEEALRLCTSSSEGRIELFVSFYSFGSGRHVKTQRQRGYCLDDCRAVGARCHVPDEGTIDLYLIKRERVEMAEARIAGAEIIEHDPDAQPF